MDRRTTPTQNSVHIGLVSSTYWPILGGMEIYLHELGRTLARQGHRVVVATRFVQQRPEPMRRLLTTVEAPRIYEQDGLTVTVLSTDFLGRLLLRPTYRLQCYPSTSRLAARLSCAALLATLHRAVGHCDVIHYSGTGRELLGFCAARVAAAWGLPLIITSHMHIGAWGNGAIDFALYRQAERMIALTDHEKAYLQAQGIDGTRIRVLGHGVNVNGTGDADRFRRARRIDGPMILFLGRKERHKGYTLLLEAAPLVWRECPAAHIVMAGPAPATTRAGAAVRHDPRLHDLGPVTEAEREDLYAACDIFCLPSQAEAFGLVYLEAWAYGKPVVALAIPTLHELIGGAQGGLLVENTPAALAQALVRLLRDAPLRARLGRAGHRRAAQSSWQNVGREMSTIYREAMASMLLRDPRLYETSSLDL